MKLIKPASILLLICLLCVPVLSACSESADNSSTAVTSGVTSDSPYYDKSQNKYVGGTSGNKYEGETITVLTCGVNEVYESEIVYNTYEEGVTEVLPTVVNDDLKVRADRLEEQLGVKLEETFIYDLSRKNAAMATQIRNGNLTMTEDYQIVVPCLYDGATLAAENQFYDLNSVAGLQIEAPWWNQEFNAAMTFGNQLYFTIGDIGLINKNSAAALYFNYDMWQTMGLDVKYEGTPYDLVKSNKWTMDLVFEVARGIGEDLDKSGSIDYDDQFGWGGQLDDMWSLFYGAGERVAKPGADGYPIISIYNERSSRIMEKMQGLVQDKAHYVSANDFFDVVQWPTVLVQQGFTDGRCMFYNAAVGTVIELGEMKQHFGIVPVPLADSTQENYYSLINPWTSTCFAIPSCVSTDKLTMVADVLNVLGAESKNTVANSYFEIALKYMKTRDDESIEMIEDYIFPNRGCDPGMVYSWGGLDILLQTMASQPVGTFASQFEAKESEAQLKLDETVGFYKGQ